MQELNMANRQCCDLDIRDYKTNKPWMFADFCNTTTAGFSGDSTYATKKGRKAIAYHNPIEGTMSIEFQCHPFRVYSLLSDGDIQTDAITASNDTIECIEAGKLTIPEGAIAGTVFVFKEGEYGKNEVQGVFAANVFTATTVGDIVVGESYEVGWLVKKTDGVRRISFNDKKIPKDFRVEMQTLDKDENGDLIPIRIIGYKASPKRSLDLSFSSTGDPATIKIDFDVLCDKDDNVLDIVEITE